MSNEFVQYDDAGLRALRQKLEALPDRLKTRLVKDILKGALTNSGAKEALTGYLKTHFKKHTGRLVRGVSSVKVSRVRSDHNRIVAFIHFKKLSIKPPRSSKKTRGRIKNLMQPSTVANWLNAGTQTHSNRRNDRLLTADKANRIVQTYQDWATAAQRRISDEYSRNKPNQRKIEKDQDKLNRYKAKIAELRSTSRHQSGRQIAGIPAHHFMEKIQRAVTDSQEVIVVAEIQKTIVDYLNSR